MNKFYNYLSIAACAILAASATSCSDKEQTCLDLNSMPQKASVTGVLSYRLQGKQLISLSTTTITSRELKAKHLLHRS